MILMDLEVARRLYRGHNEHNFRELPANVTHPYDLLPVGVAIALVSDWILADKRCQRTFGETSILNAFAETEYFCLQLPQKKCGKFKSEFFFREKARKRKNAIQEIMDRVGNPNFDQVNDKIKTARGYLLISHTVTDECLV